MAAWIPPWALAVLQDAFEPLVTRSTRAPSAPAAHAAARPEPPRAHDEYVRSSAMGSRIDWILQKQP